MLLKNPARAFILFVRLQSIEKQTFEGALYTVNKDLSNIPRTYRIMFTKIEEKNFKY